MNICLIYIILIVEVDDVVKKIIKFLFVIIIVAGIGYGVYYLYKKYKPIDYTGKWHIEINKDYINIREFPEQYSRNMGKATKGEKFLVEEVNLEDPVYVWYKLIRDGLLIQEVIMIG